MNAYASFLAGAMPNWALKEGLFRPSCDVSNLIHLDEVVQSQTGLSVATQPTPLLTRWLEAELGFLYQTRYCAGLSTWMRSCKAKLGLA